MDGAAGKSENIPRWEIFIVISISPLLLDRRSSTFTSKHACSAISLFSLRCCSNRCK